MKTFGKIMCVVLVLALLAGGCFALYKATNSFKDWNPSNWGENIKPPEKTGETIIKSQKYGTFVLPKQSMMVDASLSIHNENFYVENNTDLTFLKNEMFNFIYSQKEFVDFGYTEDFNETFKQYLELLKTEELILCFQETHGSKDYLNNLEEIDVSSGFYDNRSLYVPKNNMIELSTKYLEEHSFLKTPIININSQNMLQLTIIPKNFKDEKFNEFNKDDRFLLNFNLFYGFNFYMKSTKITYQGQSINYNVVINSDKNIPLTEGIYNEIMNDPTTVVTYA